MSSVLCRCSKPVCRHSPLQRTHKGKLRDVLAKKMRRLRAARDLSQQALAHECGTNGPNLCRNVRA
jgi:hypothetical protein